MAPLVRDRKGEHEKIFDKIRKDGFVRFRLDGDIYNINESFEIDKNKKHTIEIIIDRLVVRNFKKKIVKLKSGDEIEEKNEDRSRLADSIETALKYGNGLMTVVDADTDEETTFF